MSLQPGQRILLWLSLIGLMVVLVVWRWQVNPPKIDTDITAFFTLGASDPIEIAAKEQVAKLLGDRVVIALHQKDRATLGLAGHKLIDRLRAEKHFQFIDHTQRPSALTSVLFHARLGLLSADDRKALEEGKAQTLVNRALAQYFSPLAILPPNAVHNDPFLLFVDFLTDNARGLPKNDKGLMIAGEGGAYVLINFQLKGSAFDEAIAQQAVATIEYETANLMSEFPGLEIITAGSIFHAAHAAKIARADMTWIGGWSSLGTILMFLLVFRRIGPLFLPILSVATGLLAGFTILVLAFDRVHVLALVFAAALVGVAVDYAAHFLTHGWQNPNTDPGTRLNQLSPSLVLGWSTTILGYAALAFAEIPGLRQVALYSIFGLSGSLVTVYLLGPSLSGLSPKMGGRHQKWLDHIGRCHQILGRIWEKNPVKRGLITFVGIMILLVLSPLKSDDDIRQLIRSNPELTANDEKIQKLAGVAGGMRFVLVEAKSSEVMLQRLEQVESQVAPLLPDKSLPPFLHIARLIPSQLRQNLQAQLVTKQLFEPYAASLKTTLKLPEMPKPLPFAPLILDQTVSADLPAELRNLLVRSDDQSWASIMIPTNVTATIDIAGKLQGLAGVRWIDPAHETSQRFGQLRVVMSWALCVGLLLVYLLLAWRHGGQDALKIMLPPLIAMASALLFLAAIGEPVRLFSILALALVFAMGVDYSIFHAEAGSHDQSATFMGVALSAATTILSLGLLGFSTLPIAHNIGSCLTVGILVAFLLSPLARKN